MIEIVITGAIIGALVAAVVLIIALRFQQRGLGRNERRQQAWERTQDIRQQQWQSIQEKRVADLEQRLGTQVQQLRNDWHVWEEKDVVRMETIAQQYTITAQQSHVELELARLPRIEEASLDDTSSSYREPAQLRDANLAQRDLSHRYLGKADLRDAQLINANLYMSDLSGACLAGANLSNANLSGANLSGADLRGAILVGANLLVADLHHTVLLGANLLKAHSLSVEQLETAIYDTSTQVDPELDATQTRLPVIRKPEAVPTPAASLSPSEQAIPETPAVTPDRILPLMEPEPLASSLPAANDNLLALVKLRLPVDRQENRHTEEADTDGPNSRRNGRRKAKAG